MLFFSGLVLGILIGWLIEWVIDWQYWRQDGSPFEFFAMFTGGGQSSASNAPLPNSTDMDSWRDRTSTAEAEASRLKTELTSAQQFQSKLADAETEIERLQAQLAAAPKPTSESAPTSTTGKRDRLTRIHGIGKVFSGKFNEAGVYTFAELAALTPERLSEIIGPDAGPKIEPESWIAQAAEFAKESQEEG